MVKPRISKAIIWWLTGNSIALMAWLAVAWAIWPWPNYGYCDFPVASWRFLFAGAPALIFLAHLVLLLFVGGYAALHRKGSGLAAAILTASVWFALGRIDFNPHAVPGDGCYEGVDLPLPDKSAK